MYNWQLKNWPKFQYDESAYASFQQAFMLNIGKVEAYKLAVDKSQNEQSMVDLLVSEAIKSSAIEGEMMSRADLISSI